ncbi:MAG: SAM-dependent methyltransferase [Treponema sp.]|nr:SAM-dependent methyltransferase [Treponema sp.]
MILSATLSKPTALVEQSLGAPYIRIKIKLITAASRTSGTAAAEARYALELYTEKQAFHKKLTEDECTAFLEAHAGKTFRSCVERTETEEITILSNKHGKITRLTKPLASQKSASPQAKLQTGAIPPATAVTAPLADSGLNRRKNYLLPEGCPVPFLVHLGVMTAEGKVLSAKYDKFRQINRFLEYIDDVLPAVLKTREKNGLAVSKENPLRIVDFGSGKSYLTFAVHHFLTKVRGLACDITGLDLKEDVIAYCASLAEKIGAEGLHFAVGDIARYGENAAPDIVITLHACDTATDYALDYAVKHNAGAILSVPCCQHEIHAQLGTEAGAFTALLRYGILKERFAALATDALRAGYLEQAGYKVQILEFIDMSHTPKNLLLRAVRKPSAASASGQKNAAPGIAALEAALGITPTIKTLLGQA